ncbi:MAG: TPD domain-containing protein [Thermoplasmatales archaeon]|nr:TPD domain-containing protein [Thermoplasmatales archaeon]
MDYKEYKKLYDGLKSHRDVKRLEKEGYDPKLVRTLYTQKVSRDVRKRHHSVKSRSKKMLNDWRHGTSIMEIAERARFPPILTAMMIFLEDGASRKEFWEYVRNPDTLNAQTARELREATENDYVYSPAANEDQRERGEWGEKLLEGWLDSQGVGYRTEDDLRGEYQKTPDALLDEPMEWNGNEIRWVESKASFGDNIEFRQNARKQLIPYTEIFGPGLVIHWVGCLNDLECPESVYVADMGVLDTELKKPNGSKK